MCDVNHSNDRRGERQRNPTRDRRTRLYPRRKHEGLTHGIRVVL